MSNSVTSELTRYYEETVRESLAHTLYNAFGTHCRQSEYGFQRLFNKCDNADNSWWQKKPSDSQIEIDFLAHVTPLSTLSDVNVAKVSENPHVSVFKSTAPPTNGASTEADDSYKQNRTVSPEKTMEQSGDGDGDGHSDGNCCGNHFQYVIAEITCGGNNSVMAKLEQLQKDCHFLCSRACPSLTDEADFRVLETVAFVAVVSPTLKAEELRKRIFSNSKPLPLLKELYNRGRFVWIEHKKTISAAVKELDSKLDFLSENIQEQNQALEAKLTEQNQALEAKLTEQNQALEAIEAKLTEQTQQTQAFEAKLTEQFALFQQFLAERFPKEK